MSSSRFAAITALALLLTGCAASLNLSEPAPKQSTGVLLGTPGGDRLNEGDKQQAYAAQLNALNDGAPGAPVSWRNPDSGRYGTVVPGPYYEQQGRRCRSYTHSVFIDGHPETVRGTACRNADGSWMPLT